MSDVLLFAYGSNLCIERLMRRVPDARYREAARLPGHALRFHKRGADGSAKADALFTGKASDEVWGALFAMDAARLPALDAFEGGYHRLPLDVELPSGQRATALTYRAAAARIDPSLLPFDWYVALVAGGARQRGLPRAYIAELVETPSRPDPDTERDRRERECLGVP